MPRAHNTSVGTVCVAPVFPARLPQVLRQSLGQGCRGHFRDDLLRAGRAMTGTKQGAGARWCYTLATPCCVIHDPALPRPLGNHKPRNESMHFQTTGTAMQTGTRLRAKALVCNFLRLFKKHIVESLVSKAANAVCVSRSQSPRELLPKKRIMGGSGKIHKVVQGDHMPAQKDIAPVSGRKHACKNANRADSPPSPTAQHLDLNGRAPV